MTTYEDLCKINKTVEEWANKAFPKMSDADFEAIVLKRDRAKFNEMLAETGLGKASVDDRVAAWYTFYDLAEASMDA